jgi:hypothetical protein
MEPLDQGLYTFGLLCVAVLLVWTAYYIRGGIP